MSLDLMSWAFKQPVEPGPKLVLLALADHANGQTGLCIPGQKSLAEQCSMSVRTVQRHLITLEEEGYIRREARMRGAGRGRTSDRYYLGDQGDNPALRRQDDTTKATNQDDQHDTVVVAEPEGNRKKEPLADKPPESSTKKKDKTFETLAEVCGISLNGMPRSSRGQLNKAAKELREIEATPELIRAKAVAYRKQYPNISLTPTALVKHWSSFDVEAKKNRKSVWETYERPEWY
ncbi:MAG TPA: helix-turn-helix domain-containing protein [Acidimicrobiia bacterium]